MSNQLKKNSKSSEILRRLWIRKRIEDFSYSFLTASKFMFTQPKKWLHMTHISSVNYSFHMLNIKNMHRTFLIENYMLNNFYLDIFCVKSILYKIWLKNWFWGAKTPLWHRLGNLRIAFSESVKNFVLNACLKIFIPDMLNKSLWAPWLYRARHWHTVQSALTNLMYF